MNDSAANGTTNWPIILDNEATQNTAVFASTAPASTSAAASEIAPDARFLSSGLELDTDIILKGR